MTTTAAKKALSDNLSLVLPEHRECFYDGRWHKPKSGRMVETMNPGTGDSLGTVADADAADIDAAVAAAKAAYATWRNVPPLERAKLLRAHRRGPARQCRGAGDDRRRRLRQSLYRDGERRERRRRADRVLRRPRHRDEGRLDPDGTRRGELLGARAARRRRPHRAVQSSVHVLRRQVGRAARRRQHRDHEAARAGAALLAAPRRADRRHPAARRVQPRARRQGGGRGARPPSGRRQDRADRQRADRTRRHARRRRHAQAASCSSSAARTR